MILAVLTATPAAAQTFIPSHMDANGVWTPARVETSTTASQGQQGATATQSQQPAPPLSAYRPMSRRRQNPEGVQQSPDLGDRQRLGGPSTPDEVQQRRGRVSRSGY